MNSSGSTPSPETLLKTAAALQRSGRIAESLTTIEKLLELRPEHAIAWNFRGNLLLECGRTAEAILAYDCALDLNGSYPEARHNRGVALMQSRRQAEAEREFARVVALKPGDNGALESLGICLAAQGKHSDAVAMFDQALAAGAGSAALHQRRAESLLQLKCHAEALKSYDCALGLADRPELRIGRGMLLLLMQRDAAALADFDRALVLSRGAGGGWLGRGIALVRLGRMGEALQALDETLRLWPGNKDALYNRATALLLLKRFEEAAQDCEELIRHDSEYPYALGALLHARLYACDWRDHQELRRKTADAVHDGRRAVHPFLNLAISDSPALNLHAAQIFAGEHPPASPPCWRGETYRHKKIRLAYLSADFYRHATAFLMAGVFEEHDRTRFETVAISFGPSESCDMRRRLEGAFDRFLDVRTASDRAIAEKLRELEIDIAVDLKGYTGDARPGILAQRSAPVQLHYLGYPGSLGAPYVDYLIADSTVIPHEAVGNYAEQVVFLPGCYQCNDTKRPDPGQLPPRSQVELPENAFVFCCFNSSFKIGPDIFSVWMRLLRSLPESVLWLLDSNSTTSANLRREAVMHGVAPERLIFARRAPLEEHLARLGLADLALDTFPYGAHTTASDAVWSRLPMVALAGESFAARVSASVLTAAGVPELITRSLDEYEVRALMLARDKPALAGFRSQLHASRTTSPLFDTVLFTRHLESAYATMYERHQNGLPPVSFAVKQRAI